MPEPPPPGRALHEPAAPWLPDKPETGGAHAAAPACRANPTPQLLIGQIIAADGAQPTTAALLQSMPGVGLQSPPGSPSCSARALTALEALRTEARDIPGAAPALLELAGAKTKRIRENQAKQKLDLRAERKSAAERTPSRPG